MPAAEDTKSRAVREENAFFTVIIGVLILATGITWIVVMSTNAEWPGAEGGVRMRRWGPEICAVMFVEGGHWKPKERHYSCAALSKVQDLVRHNRSIDTVFTYPSGLKPKFQQSETDDYVTRIDEESIREDLTWICPDRSWGAEWEHLARLEVAALFLGVLSVVGFGGLLAAPQLSSSSSPQPDLEDPDKKPISLEERLRKVGCVACVIAVVFCAVVLITVPAVSAARIDRTSACSTGEVPSARSVLFRGGKVAGPVTLAVLTLLLVAAMATVKHTITCRGSDGHSYWRIFSCSNGHMTAYSMAILAASTVVAAVSIVTMGGDDSDFDNYVTLLFFMISSWLVFIFVGSLSLGMCCIGKCDGCCAMTWACWVFLTEIGGGASYLCFTAIFVRGQYAPLMILPAVIVALNLPVQIRYVSQLKRE